MAIDSFTIKASPKSRVLKVELDQTIAKYFARYPATSQLVETSYQLMHNSVATLPKTDAIYIHTNVPLVVTTVGSYTGAQPVVLNIESSTFLDQQLASTTIQNLSTKVARVQIVYVNSFQAVAPTGSLVHSVDMILPDSGNINITGIVEPVDGSSTVTLTSIGVTGSSTLQYKSNAQLIATGLYSDGSSQILTNVATWTSITPSIVSVTRNSGLVIGQAVGNTTVHCAYQGITSNAFALSVIASLIYIEVSGNTDVNVGGTTQLTAVGHYDDGTTIDVTSTVSWVSLDETVATVSSSGLVTGISGGSVSIVGSLDGSSTPITISVVVSTVAIQTFGAAGLVSDGGAVLLHSFDGATQPYTINGVQYSSEPADQIVVSSLVLQGVASFEDFVYLQIVNPDGNTAYTPDFDATKVTGVQVLTRQQLVGDGISNADFDVLVITAQGNGTPTPSTITLNGIPSSGSPFALTIEFTTYQTAPVVPPITYTTSSSVALSNIVNTTTSTPPSNFWCYTAANASFNPGAAATGKSYLSTDTLSVTGGYDGTNTLSGGNLSTGTVYLSTVPLYSTNNIQFTNALNVTVTNTEYYEVASTPAGPYASSVTLNNTHTIYTPGAAGSALAFSSIYYREIGSGDTSGSHTILVQNIYLVQDMQNSNAWYTEYQSRKPALIYEYDDGSHPVSSYLAIPSTTTVPRWVFVDYSTSVVDAMSAVGVSYSSFSGNAGGIPSTPSPQVRAATFSTQTTNSAVGVWVTASDVIPTSGSTYNQRVLKLTGTHSGSGVYNGTLSVAAIPYDSAKVYPNWIAGSTSTVNNVISYPINVSAGTVLSFDLSMQDQGVYSTVSTHGIAALVDPTGGTLTATLVETDSTPSHHTFNVTINTITPGEVSAIAILLNNPGTDLGSMFWFQVNGIST